MCLLVLISVFAFENLWFQMKGVFHRHSLFCQ